MRHRAEVAHHSKGRIRLRVPSAKGNPVALERIRISLAPVEGVRHVEVNEAIGSITVHYDPKQHPDFHGRLAGEGSHRDTLDIVRPKALFDMLNKFDSTVKTATNNAIDLKVVMPLALAGVAFLELGLSASTPMWVTLGLFSFNHFVELHSPLPNPSGAPMPQARRKLRPFP